jgi:Rrf2 family protein
MRMSEGVEWAAHCCLLLDWLGHDQALDVRGPVPAARLAEAYEVPAAYLNKQLQALTRAGILMSLPGKRGGFRLARPLDRITMMDIVAAIEGPDNAFSCTEIRQRGPGAGRTPPDDACGITTAMRTAELAWRRALAAQRLSDIKAGADAHQPHLGDSLRRWHEQRWHQQKGRTP